MIIPLSAAAAGTCGGKAGALGALLRAGLPVPDGFVVPFAATARMAGEGPVDGTVIETLERALGELGDPHVAVRSSAADEDGGTASAAGQYESFLGVRGAGEVAGAVRACRASMSSPRAEGYRAARAHGGPPPGDPAMAVIVQRHLDAEVSGVMFTPAAPGGATEIEVSWGLGLGVVGGTVTPDAYRVGADGSVTVTVADKRTRADRHGTRVVTGDVPADARNRPALDDATATRLAALGGEIAALFGGRQDVEWAIADGRIWILQARPVTAAPPPRPPSHDPGVSAAVLTGTPGSRGTATGAARIVRGPRDFARVRAGDILVCPFTDPAWTPLLGLAAGVVTETGGVLSHAAIVAREYGIPAVLGVPAATNRLGDGAVVIVDGAAGTVTPTDGKEPDAPPGRAARL
ncbi:PEP/pyruvate-binding domain-containing protein [Spongiactinospora sp. TRM90649]|uniref:PEP/pyruvate-binding domain-containing protein n=1 Tax=Spongiactinospora sp. TRM90649 TaxID=3031114 RepID=UPI0023F85F38|nr:PEP/pyruvate-binding domain-containing protein [Spongiactinospora sp. TRM90649]MDF5754391.1 PEP/pyruvate-binding domain-containing protein [Spongiactinospora sp. TRM90649]